MVDTENKGIEITHEFVDKDYSKLFKWEGFKEELFWIIFFIALLVSCWGYYDLYKRHQELLNKECVWHCRVNEFIEYWKEKDPNVHIVCDDITKTCQFSGVSIEMLPEELRNEFNESNFKEGESLMNATR